MQGSHRASLDYKTFGLDAFKKAHEILTRQNATPRLRARLFKHAQLDLLSLLAIWDNYKPLQAALDYMSTAQEVLNDQLEDFQDNVKQQLKSVGLEAVEPSDSDTEEHNLEFMFRPLVYWPRGQKETAISFQDFWERVNMLPNGDCETRSIAYSNGSLMAFDDLLNALPTRHLNRQPIESEAEDLTTGGGLEASASSCQ